MDVNGKSVKVGDTVDFTVAADVPHAAAGWDAYPFTITDTASKGLQIAAKSAFTVQFGDHTTVDPDLYTITQEGNAQSGTTTTIYLPMPQRWPVGRSSCRTRAPSPRMRWMA